MHRRAQPMIGLLVGLGVSTPCGPSASQLDVLLRPLLSLPLSPPPSTQACFQARHISVDLTNSKAKLGLILKATTPESLAEPPVKIRSKPPMPKSNN